MNTEVLEILMQRNNIRSYFQLSKKMDFPYTTLLDLVHNKTDRLSSIKRLSNYFNVPLTTLTNKTTYQFLIDEDDNIKIEVFLNMNKEEQTLSSTLLSF